MRAPTALSLLALTATVGTLGCREVDQPFRPSDRDVRPDSIAVRLTYAPGDDRTPAWTHDGDSIIYTTSSWELNPRAPGTLLVLPADGSAAAAELLRGVQAGNAASNWITSPAPEAGSNRLAFIHVGALAPVCAGAPDCPGGDAGQVRLQAGGVHVRDRDALGALLDDVVLPLVFAGYRQEQDPAEPDALLRVSEYHPFQREFVTSGRPFFRPTWHPDGNEIVVSDGLRLLRWPVGGSAVEIPGTADGIMPAWSPNGEWIAYARYVRGAASDFYCTYTDGSTTPPTLCRERRIVYDVAEPVIVLTRPDGSEELVLGPGTDPAWSPDGSSVYASASLDVGRRIVRMPIDGSGVEIVPNTSGGVEPAVSPDGRRLAFARRANGFGFFDVWIVPLP